MLHPVLAQTPAQVEDSVNHYLNQISSGENDEERLAAHNRMSRMLSRALLKTDVFHYPFNDVKKMAILTDPDNELRVWSWHVPLNNKPPQYGCFVVRYDEKKEMCKVDELQPAAWPEHPEWTSRNADQWLGVLYFKLVPIKEKGKDYFLLFGWDGHDELSNKKLVEVLHFPNGKLKLGRPTFRRDGKSAYRLVFEYHQDAVFSVNYSEELDAVVYDDLGPLHPSLEGNHAHYVPQQTSSGYQRNKQVWEFLPEVDYKRPKDARDKQFNDPQGPDMSRKRNSKNPLTGE